MNYRDKTCYIVLLNYKKWADTIECLESILKSDYSSYKIIVCDNKSENDSLDKISGWADGNIYASTSNHVELKKLVYPFSQKPIPYMRITENDIDKIKEINTKIVLVANNRNGGFAYGNNVAIKLAMNQTDCSYIWCLNTDTVVDPKCLSSLIEKMESDKTIGICGARLYDYYNPANIQTEGGSIFNKWTTIQRKPTKEEVQDDAFSFISGASMMISPEFIKNVGLMYEGYFLYFEELDWAARNKGRYKLAYSPVSVVYHKEGSTTGSNKRESSELSDFYLFRNKILFTRRFYPYCLPTVYLEIFLAAMNRLRKGLPSRSVMILKILFGLKKHLLK